MQRIYKSYIKAIDAASRPVTSLSRQESGIRMEDSVKPQRPLTAYPLRTTTKLDTMKTDSDFVVKNINDVVLAGMQKKERYEWIQKIRTSITSGNINMSNAFKMHISNLKEISRLSRPSLRCIEAVSSPCDYIVDSDSESNEDSEGSSVDTPREHVIVAWTRPIASAPPTTQKRLIQQQDVVKKVEPQFVPTTSIEPRKPTKCKPPKLKKIGKLPSDKVKISVPESKANKCGFLIIKTAPTSDEQHIKKPIRYSTTMQPKYDYRYIHQRRDLKLRDLSVNVATPSAVVSMEMPELDISWEPIRSPLANIENLLKNDAEIFRLEPLVRVAPKPTVLRVESNNVIELVLETEPAVALASAPEKEVALEQEAAPKQEAAPEQEAALEKEVENNDAASVISNPEGQSESNDEQELVFEDYFEVYKDLKSTDLPQETETKAESENELPVEPQPIEFFDVEQDIQQSIAHIQAIFQVTAETVEKPTPKIVDVAKQRPIPKPAKKDSSKANREKKRSKKKKVMASLYLAGSLSELKKKKNSNGKSKPMKVQ